MTDKTRTYRRRWAVARKAGKCARCGAAIEPGMDYWQVQPPFVPATRFCSPGCEWL